MPSEKEVVEISIMKQRCGLHSSMAQMASKWLKLVLVGMMALYLVYNSATIYSMEDVQDESQPHIYWVITSGGLHVINKVALESIFLHNPGALLTIYLKEGLEEANSILSVVIRLREDGYRIQIVNYNFRVILTSFLENFKDVDIDPTIIQSCSLSICPSTSRASTGDIPTSQTS